MLYLKVITVNFKAEMEQVFNDNPRLKREIEYDLRQFDESGQVGNQPTNQSININDMKLMMIRPTL